MEPTLLPGINISEPLCIKSFMCQTVNFLIPYLGFLLQGTREKMASDMFLQLLWLWISVCCPQSWVRTYPLFHYSQTEAVVLVSCLPFNVGNCFPAKHWGPGDLSKGLNWEYNFFLQIETVQLFSYCIFRTMLLNVYQFRVLVCSFRTGTLMIVKYVCVSVDNTFCFQVLFSP